MILCFNFLLFTPIDAESLFGRVLEGDHASFVELVPFSNSYCYVYAIPNRLSAIMFWSDVDTNSWDIVPLAVLSTHFRSAAYPPQTVSPRLS